MATAELDHLNMLGTPQTFSRTKSMLLETMKLVEQRKSIPVPNHLLDTKIYTKIAGNSQIQASPPIMHFSGFKPGLKQTKVLKLTNVSTDIIRMHIIPPQTKYFSIQYTKQYSLVPGLALECMIEFIADEWRYFYDCIRIHSQGDENLLIPLHSYPVMGMDSFPNKLSFCDVPVGQSRQRIVPLQSLAPLDFDFQIAYLQAHPALTVSPLAGTVQAHGIVELVVEFSPTEFSTAHMQIQLVVSQFNSLPLICTVTGSSRPGLAKEIIESKLMLEDEPILLDPRSITPVERARTKRKVRDKNAQEIMKRPKEIEKDGIRFPSNLDTPYAVCQVLNQEPGKLRTKDIKETLLARKGELSGSTRQLKEAVFEMAVSKDMQEERQNQLRWQSKLGDDQITIEQKSDILEIRQNALNEYRRLRGVPQPEKEALRTCTHCSFRRTLRLSETVGEEGIRFDPYKNDMWDTRYYLLWTFQQIARKVIIQNRAQKRVQGLRRTVIYWADKEFFPQTPSAFATEDSITSSEEEELPYYYILPPRIQSIKFPTYADLRANDDMAVDALGLVRYRPTEVTVPKKTPYFNLKVPQQYKLMGYSPHDVHAAAVNYISPALNMALRQGAEDEIITLETPNLPAPPVINEGDMELEELSDTPVPSKTITLRPPEALFQPIVYPSLHIFNPAPGLQVFQPPLPYAEIDPDFHLCPLPRYTSQEAGQHGATQKKFLDRDDVIRNVMSWKKFPLQSLSMLPTTPTLINVWSPRWTDPFISDLIPTTIPPMQVGLSREDENNIIDDDEDNVGIPLTPEIIEAKFNLINQLHTPEERTKEKDSTEEHTTQPGQAEVKQEEHPKRLDNFPHGKLPHTNIAVSRNGPIIRAQREAELDFYLRKKFNRLGGKINKRIEQLNAAKTNPDLILK